MWSYVQYRRIGKQVEAEVKNQSTVTGKTGKASTDLESGRGLAGQHIDGIEEKNGTRLVVPSNDDPLDPKRWPLADRCKNMAILFFLIFVQGWAGAAESGANSMVSQEFGVNKVVEELSTAMYLFGIASGSLLAGPVSETFGRNPAYLISTFCYLCFVLGSALVRTFGGKIVCRFFVGLFASGTLSTNGSSVRDQFGPVAQTFVFPFIAWANVAVPAIAPIAAGWVVQNPRLGWRWTEWITLIISGSAFIIALLFLPETYLPLLLDWKARHLRRVTGDDRYASEHAEGSFTSRVRHDLPLPARFLAKEPVISVLGSYLILVNVLLFTFLSGFEYIFKKTYGLSSGQTGSCFAAIAAGATAFLVLAPSHYFRAQTKVHHAKSSSSVNPEFKLWPGIFTTPLLPISLFWLGWAADPKVSIWSGLAACFAFGVVMMGIYVSSYEYIIDSYGEHAAVALASITLMRYVVAGGMVMAARPMYEGIGVHWTLTLLGCLAVILTPAPLIFWKIGHKLRRKSPYAKSSDA